VNEWDDERMRGEGPWASTGERARAQELLCESCAEYLYFYIWNTFSKRSRWMQPKDWEK